MHIHKSSQTDFIITFGVPICAAMIPILYETIISGDIHRLKMIITAYTDDDDDRLLFQQTPLNSTILHVAAQFRRNDCVREIFCRCPSLLMQQNLKGDTPLHIAARLGLSDVVFDFLNYHTQIVERVGNGGGGDDAHRRAEGSSLSTTTTSLLQQLVRMTNKENDTALHEAVRNHQFEVVKLITEADPTFEYLPNDAGDTPLYLAAQEGLYDVVVQILETCPSSAHIGPHGRTALHEAVMSGNTDIVGVILEKKPGTIIKEVDEDGWSALHYAARFGMCSVSRQLLEVDPTIAYMSDTDDRTALHIATVCFSEKSLKVIEEVRRGCPDCLELIDNNGQNFLHVAAENGNYDVIRYIVVESGMVENLINEKDNDGNTPLHLFVKYGRIQCVQILSSVNGVNKGATNKSNLTPYEVARNRLLKMEYGPEMELLQSAMEDLHVSNLGWNHIKQLMKEDIDLFKRKEKRKKEEIDETIMLHKKAMDKEEREEMERVRQTHMLVATLIATVAFAAGFTLPGGYNSDGEHKGMAVLTENPAFIAFMVFNTVAMLLSTFAVFINFWSTLLGRDDKVRVVRLIKVAVLCMPFAIIAMVIAFVAGTYAMLSHSPGLAISLCLLGCSFFFFCLFPLFKLQNLWRIVSLLLVILKSRKPTSLISFIQ